MALTLWWGTTGIQLTDEGEVREVHRSQLEAIEDSIPHYQKVVREQKVATKQEKQVKDIYINFGKFAIGFLIGFPIFSLIIHFIMKVV